VGGQHHAPAALPPRKTLYPLYRRLGGPHGRSGRVRKISPPPGFFFFCSILCFIVLVFDFSIVVCVDCIVSYCMLWIFPAVKIRRLRSGANPRSWVPEASMQTPRPPNPLIGSPDRPGRNQSLYRLSYPAHVWCPRIATRQGKLSNYYRLHSDIWYQRCGQCDPSLRPRYIALLSYPHYSNMHTERRQIFLKSHHWMSSLQPRRL
jgi:hypothetical protein